MRTIHIRISDPSNFTFQIDVVESPALIQMFGTRYKKIIRNAKGFAVIFVNPKLRRGIVRGITIVEDFGDHDRWLSDRDVSNCPLWGTT